MNYDVIYSKIGNLNNKKKHNMSKKKNKNNFSHDSVVKFQINDKNLILVRKLVCLFFLFFHAFFFVCLSSFFFFWGGGGDFVNTYYFVFGKQT